MKRVSGLWYIKHMGIWFLAGKDIESAFFYFLPYTIIQYRVFFCPNHSIVVYLCIVVYGSMIYRRLVYCHIL